MKIKSVPVRVYLKALFAYWRQRFGEAHLNQVSASLAFTTTLALVPMLSIATMLFSYMPSFINLRAAFQAWLLSTLMPGNLSQGIASYLAKISSNAKGLTIFGLGGLMVTTLLTLITIEHAFNQVWGVKNTRGIIKRFFLYGAATVLGPVFLGLSIYLTSILVSASNGWIKNLPFNLELLAALLPMLLTAFTFLLVYKMGTSAVVKWKDALIGGLCAAVIFECTKLGFTFFVTKVSVYKTLYGAFSVLPLFLLWIYLTWWVTMAGAVLTASLPHIRAGLGLQTQKVGLD